MPPFPPKINFSLEMACFAAFQAALFVRVLARNMLNFPPELVIRVTLKIFWEIMNTMLEKWGC